MYSEGQNTVRMLSYWFLKEHLLHTFSICGREILTILPQAQIMWITGGLLKDAMKDMVSEE